MPGYSDKSGQCKGNVKEGVIYVWLKNIPKEVNFYFLTV